MQINEELAKDGSKIIVVEKDNKLYRLNGMYRPMEEAIRFAEQFKSVEEEGIVFVYGFGNGMFAKAIVDSCPKSATIVFFEPCEEIIRITEKIFDIDRFCKEHHCFIISGDDKNKKNPWSFPICEFGRILENHLITYINRDKIYHCALPKYEELFSEQYHMFLDLIQEKRFNLLIQINNARDFGKKAVLNNINLLKYIPDSYCIDDFFNQYPKDLPVIIVSAGPSLEKNAALLNEIHNKALILCVDSAIPYMMRKNIIPNGIVSIDARKDISLFSDERLSNIPLIGYSDMSSKVIEKVKPKMLIMGGASNDYIRNLYEKAGHKLPDIDYGGSVATLTCALCKEMGFETIILVGQDLALTGNQMYAGNKDFDIENYERGVLLVKAYNGGEVYTTYDYEMYIHWFEHFAETYNKLTLINATEGGALIEGFTNMKLRDALSRYATKEYNLDTIINQIPPAFNNKDKIFLKEELKREAFVYDEIINKMRRGISLAQLGIQGTKKNNTSELYYDKINVEMTALCEYCDDKKEFSLIKSIIDADSIDSFAGVFSSTTYDGSVAEQYKKMKMFFECMFNGAETIREMFNQVGI